MYYREKSVGREQYECFLRCSNMQYAKIKAATLYIDLPYRSLRNYVQNGGRK